MGPDRCLEISSLSYTMYGVQYDDFAKKRYFLERKDGPTQKIFPQLCTSSLHNE